MDEVHSQPQSTTDCVELKHLDRTPDAPKDAPPAYTPNDTVVDMAASAETPAQQVNGPPESEPNTAAESTSPNKKNPVRVWSVNSILLLVLVGFSVMIWYVTNG
jgi:hypothetical protein